MKHVTPEEIYQEYRTQYLMYTKKIRPRAIKHWDKVKAKPEWIYFERLAYKVNAGQGMLNYKVLIEALIDFYKGHVPTKMLVHPKSIKLYQNHIRMTGDTNNPDRIYRELMKSLLFVCEFCRDNGIKNLEDYVRHNAELLPSFFKHIKNGQITMYFAAIIPNSKALSDEYNTDVLIDVKDKFNAKYRDLHRHAVSIDKVYTLERNLDTYFKEIVEKIS